MFELSVEGSLARLRLSRPEARNAIPADQWEPLAAAARHAVARGARLLILEGSREAFCAGADLADFASFTDDPAAVARFRAAMRAGIDGVAELPIATIGFIEGPCFGAGVALAMACDIRVATEGARFAITPAKFGISYPQEDVARLVALVGPGQAARLLLGAQTIDAAEALRIGLVDLGPDGAEPALHALTSAILANSAQSIGALKARLGLAARGVSSDEGQDRSFDALFGCDEFAARLAALRPPR